MRFLATLFVLLLAVQPAAQAQSADDLFQQALVAERTEGNLLGAISLYERVVEASTDRALTARALVRIGQNYERLGRENALTAYRRIVADFGDQAEALGIARERLAALEPPAAQQVEMKQSAFMVPFRSFGNWEQTGLYGADISPSGRYLVREGSPMAIDDLATGETRDLDAQTIGCAWPVTMQMSPDETKVAFQCVRRGESELPSGIYSHDLETGENTLLVGEGDVVSPGSYVNMEIYDWTHDGAYILASFRRGRGFAGVKVGLVPTDGGDVVMIDENAMTDERRWRELNGACMMFGDRLMVAEYVNPPDFESNQADRRIELWVVNRDSQTPVRALGDAAFDYELFGCDTSNGQFYYSRKRDDVRTLYAAQITPDGNVSNPEFLQALPSNIDPILANNGRLYYTLDFNPIQVSIKATIEPETGAIEELDLGSGDFVPMLSPRNGYSVAVEWTTGTTFIEADDGSQNPLEFSSNGKASPVGNSGGYLIMRNGPGPDETWVVDPTVLSIVHHIPDTTLLWVSADRRLGYGLIDRELLEVDLVEKTQRRLFDIGNTANVWISSEGDWFAIQERNREEQWLDVVVIGRDDVENRRAVLRIQQPWTPIRMQWAGGKLYAYSRTSFWRYDPQSEVLDELSTFAELDERGYDIQRTPFAVSPDGRTVRNSLPIRREEADVEITVIDPPRGGGR